MLYKTVFDAAHSKIYFNTNVKIVTIAMTINKDSDPPWKSKKTME
jgi:hypothetical protein